MNILMTVLTLAFSGGSNCYVRDVAKEMIKRGHKVAVYSPKLGPLADEIRALGADVFDHPNAADFWPDVIHGQHHLDLMPVMTLYPKVPVVYFTHGVVPFQEKPPAQLPRVVSHVCISVLCKNELLKYRNIPEDDIQIIYNFVDENRFPFVKSWERDFPKKIANVKCLVMGNVNPKEIDRIRNACRDLGVILDEIGKRSEFGNHPEPHLILPDYEIVFAYGRSAMEAMYCGCDVVLVYATGSGEYVTDENFADLRSRNFGFTTCQKQLGEHGFKELILRILKDRESRNFALTESNRATLRSKIAMDSIEKTYENAILAWKWRSNSYSTDQLTRLEGKAMSDYFLELRGYLQWKKNV